MFTDFVKSELTEDQLLPTLRQLLPILLNILGDQEVRQAVSLLRASHIEGDNTAPFPSDTRPYHFCLQTMCGVPVYGQGCTPRTC